MKKVEQFVDDDDRWMNKLNWNDQYIKTYFIYTFGFYSHLFALFCVTFVNRYVCNGRLNHMGVYYKQLHLLGIN